MNREWEGEGEKGKVYHLFNLEDNEISNFWHKMLPEENDNF